MTSELNAVPTPMHSALPVASATPSPAVAGGGTHINPLIRYLAAIRRYKWLVVLLTLTGLAGGYLASRFQKRTFSASGQVLIADDKPQGPFEGTPMYASDALSHFLESYPVITPVVESRRLFITGPKKIGEPTPGPGPTGPDAAIFDHFTWNELEHTGSFTLKISPNGQTWELAEARTNQKETGAVGDSIGRKFGFLWLPTIQTRWFGKSFAFDVTSPREVADDIINKQLHITMAFRGARFMNVSLTGQDPVQVAGTLNDVLDRFVQLEGASKRSQIDTQVVNLDSQLTQATIKLHSAEHALEEFRVATVTLPRDQLPVAPGLQQTTPEGYDAYLQKRTSLDVLKRDRVALAAALAKAEAGSLAVDVWMAIPTVQARPDLKQVLTEYASLEAQLRDARLKYEDTCSDCSVDMPRLIEKRNQVGRVTVPAYARIVLTQLDSDIASATTDVAHAAAELANIPNRTIMEQRLERERDIQADIVSTLTRSYMAKRLEQDNAVNDVSIWSRAVVPLHPAKSKAMLIVAAGLLGGLAIGLAIAFLLDITDKRVRWADQVTSGLGLTILGVVPEIGSPREMSPTAEEAAQVIEAFRSIRLNLAHTASASSITFTVSSPSPGDGKSLISSNLALSFAQARYRTLLIDGDTRRGEMHRTFGVDRRPGLIDYLAGELPMSALLRPTTHPNLQLITSGSRKRNSPELLGSPRMRELISTMEGQFDVIIVDSPPLGAGIDPFVLGTVTSKLMLVLRAGATEKDLAEAKLQIVDQLPIQLVGAVLNDVRTTMNDYKYYSYSAGYGASDEDAPVGMLNAPAAES